MLNSLLLYGAQAADQSKIRPTVQIREAWGEYTFIRSDYQKVGQLRSGVEL